MTKSPYPGKAYEQANVKPGDKVRVTLGEEYFTGIVVAPRHADADQFVTIKVDPGYYGYSDLEGWYPYRITKLKDESCTLDQPKESSTPSPLCPHCLVGLEWVGLAQRCPTCWWVLG